jgi:uncharacterized membrane protein YedE/YeeE
MEIVNFDPITSYLGGLILGGSAMMLYILRGDVAGINGMVTGILRPIKGEVSWRILFIIGLVIGGILYRSYGGALETLEPAVEGYWVVLAGLLVGLGATFGSGCTSGHGICGISRWSVRSMTATVTFMVTAIITVFIIKHVLGGLS